MDILRSSLWDSALIPVTPASEPDNFDKSVRQPGAAFLSKTPHPTSDAWRKHDYWRRAIGDLLLTYRYICSYSGSWTKASDAGKSMLSDSSVDHFMPKSMTPTLAYEWANFRLSRARLNSYKGNHNDVLDPFSLATRWFIINFRTFLISPNRSLPKSKGIMVQKTIDRLKLNTDNDYVEERVEVVREYCLGKSTMGILNQFWPFIASEMRAQDFDNVFLPYMRSIFAARARRI